MLGALNKQELNLYADNVELGLLLLPFIAHICQIPITVFFVQFKLYNQ